ncbi:MAG: aldose 1-epimerase family protein, partial [Clostridia bacterium]|nr:aldose 1-epimerase family protein [Clostridia bacterium]
MALITISSAKLQVVLSSVGAEIQSVTDAMGRERMWQGDESIWSGRAPILFPVAGGFRDDQYIFRGKTYPMTKHGFVRRREWQVESATENEAVFLMTDKHEGFPFDYALRAIFRAEGDTLHVTYRVNNLQEDA